MKCEFSAEGVLTIVPENAVEQFALSKWDRTKIDVRLKEQWFSFVKNAEELNQLIESRRTQWQAFLEVEARDSELRGKER